MAQRQRAATKRRQRNGNENPRAQSGKAGARHASRYTPPVPDSVRHSPPWYPWALLGVITLGVLVIVLNYVQALPASPTNWYTLGGLLAILAGAVAATYYR